MFDFSRFRLAGICQTIVCIIKAEQEDVRLCDFENYDRSVLQQDRLPKRKPTSMNEWARSAQGCEAHFEASHNSYVPYNNL